VFVQTDSSCQRWEAGATLMALVVLVTTVPNVAHAVGPSPNRPSRSFSSGKLSAARLDRQKLGNDTARQEAIRAQGLERFQGRPTHTFLNPYREWKTQTAPGAVSGAEATALDRDIALAGSDYRPLRPGMRNRGGIEVHYGRYRSRSITQIIKEMKSAANSRGIVRYRDSGGSKFVNVANRGNRIRFVDPKSGRIIGRIQDGIVVDFVRTDAARPATVYPPQPSRSARSLALRAKATAVLRDHALRAKMAGPVSVGFFDLVGVDKVLEPLNRTDEQGNVVMLPSRQVHDLIASAPASRWIIQYRRDGEMEYANVDHNDGRITYYEPLTGNPLTRPTETIGFAPIRFMRTDRPALTPTATLRPGSVPSSQPTTHHHDTDETANASQRANSFRRKTEGKAKNGEKRQPRKSRVKILRFVTESSRTAQGRPPAWVPASKQLSSEGYEPQQNTVSLVGQILSSEGGPTGTVAVIHPDGRIDRFRIRRTNVAFGKILVFSPKRPNRPYVIDFSYPDWEFGGANGANLRDSLQPSLLYLRMDQAPKTGNLIHNLREDGLDIRSAMKTALIKERTAQGKINIRDAIGLMKAYGPGTLGTLSGDVEIRNGKLSRSTSHRRTQKKKYLLRNERGTVKVQGGRRSGNHEATMTWPGFTDMFNVTLSINHNGMSEMRTGATETMPPTWKAPSISWWSKAKHRLERIWQRIFKNRKSRHQSPVA
jgi:hypothetical protein